MTPPPRLHWVDHAKAIGIVLVVVGHTSALPPEVREFIYRFHMPLFFFLAGVLTRPDRLAEGFRPWVARQTRALVIPFLGFFTISWIWWLLIRGVGEKAKEAAGLPWWAPLNGLLWETGETLFINPPLWFFPALFVTSVAFWGVWRVLPKCGRAMEVAVPGLVLTLVMLASVRPSGWVGGSEPNTPPDLFRLWWSVDLLPWLLPFYVAGSWFKKPSEWVRQISAWSIFLSLMCCVVILFGCIVYATSGLPAFDLNGREFGGGPIHAGFFFLWMMVGLGFLIKTIPPNRLTDRLSRDTIIIFPLHGLWFSVFTGVSSLVFHRGDWKETGGWPAVAVYAVGAIGLSLAVAPLVRRWLPWLVGGR